MNWINTVSGALREINLTRNLIQLTEMYVLSAILDALRNLKHIVISLSDMTEYLQDTTFILEW